MKAILDRCMERNEDCTLTVAEEMKARFRSRLTLADQLFDGQPFSMLTPGGAWQLCASPQEKMRILVVEDETKM